MPIYVRSLSVATLVSQESTDAQAMARTKQATPLRREPSSEYTSKAENGTPSRSAKNSDKQLIDGNGATLGGAAEHLLEDVVPGVKEAGALQFLIAVGGIYGSL